MRYSEIVQHKLDSEALSEEQPSGGVPPLTPEKARKRAAKQAQIDQQRQAANAQHAQKMRSLALKARQL